MNSMANGTMRFHLEGDKCYSYLLTTPKIEDLAAKIHKDFLEKLKYARVWGKNVYDGQMVQRDHILQDGDIVEVHV